VFNGVRRILKGTLQIIHATREIECITMIDLVMAFGANAPSADT